MFWQKEAMKVHRRLNAWEEIPCRDTPGFSGRTVTKDEYSRQCRRAADIWSWLSDEAAETILNHVKKQYELCAKNPELHWTKMQCWKVVQEHVFGRPEVLF